MNLSTRKIGIITIDDASNLGNRLQNYALQTVLQDMSVIAETLFCISDETLLTKLEYYAKNIVKYIIDYKLYRSTYKVVRKRKNIFKQFNEQKILKSLFVIKKMFRRMTLLMNTIFHLLQAVIKSGILYGEKVSLISIS